MSKLTQRIKSNANPTIFGIFNNWQAQPMIKVDSLARVLDTKPKPDFLQMCKDANKCRKNITDPK